MHRIGTAFAVGMAVSFTCLGVFSAAFAGFLTATDLREQSLETAVYPIHAVAALIGGFAAARKTGVRGWYIGGCFGMAYAVAVLLVGFLAFDVPWTKHSLLTASISVPSGVLGGMIGVGSSKTSA
ncbi:MAG: hypothetical protein BLM47_08320 [Candidatus Reconcilbacillus cellulovorans]|uniref:TIGR04086 family membrane protein n=1 Tax=Candidatus Reconcilbacillus cellulovorans TaxID=1906605 RepID=A0A2A6DZT4_9BACL|nr:MAG: hypothetical protein BLM47_08320 [Candidatus Reconcilbacillus cellulovorans]